MKTGLSDPLHIATISPPDLAGLIGLILCPRKKDCGRDWDRDLDIDLDAVREWGPTSPSLSSSSMRSSFPMCEASPMPSRIAG